jgi:hypothetical protein
MPRAWEGLQLPITEDDRVVFNAATVVQLGDGKKASLASHYPLLYRHNKRKNRTVAQAL